MRSKQAIVSTPMAMRACCFGVDPHAIPGGPKGREEDPLMRRNRYGFPSPLLRLGRE
jgi:hypothetical protein